MFQSICKHCKRAFLALRSNTAYCSLSCKSKAADAKRNQLHTLRCHHCNKTFTHRHGTTRYCSKACYHAERRYDLVLVCQACGNDFTPPQHGNAVNQRFCSRTCGAKHRQANITKPCAQCGAPFTVFVSDAQRLKHCSKACSVLAQRQEAERNMRTLTCQHCGNVFTVPGHRGYYKYCSRSCVRARHGETSIERCIREALNDLCIAYQQEHQVGVYCIDFYLPSASIALEVDGDFWHGSPEAQQRDTRRDQRLALKGIITVRIRQEEIEANSRDVVALVKHRLAPYGLTQ